MGSLRSIEDRFSVDSARLMKMRIERICNDRKSAHVKFCARLWSSVKLAQTDLRRQTVMQA